MSHLAGVGLHAVESREKAFLSCFHTIDCETQCIKSVAELIHFTARRQDAGFFVQVFFDVIQQSRLRFDAPRSGTPEQLTELLRRNVTEEVAEVFLPIDLQCGKNSVKILNETGVATQLYRGGEEGVGLIAAQQQTTEGSGAAADASIGRKFVYRAEGQLAILNQHKQLPSQGRRAFYADRATLVMLKFF